MAGILGKILGTNVKAPAARDPATEGRNMFRAQTELAPGIFSQVRTYAPEMSGIQADGSQVISKASREQNPMLYGLLDTLGTQANEELGREGWLSPDEVRQVEQDSRAAWNDRGLVRSTPAAFAEVMNLYGSRRNRLNQSRNFATGVTGLLSGERDFAFNAGANNTAGLMTMFDPFNDYGQDLANTNYNAEAAANIATANNNAALMSGLMGMGGSLGGAGIMAGCWVARAVYGVHDQRWRMFRNWLLSDAPRWFRGLYLAYGQDFAGWISSKPRIKSVIRRWMDARIGLMRSTEIPGPYKHIIAEAF